MKEERVKFLDRLSRVTSSDKFIPEVDGLRFIAIALVVLFHLRTSVVRLGGFDEQVLQDDLFFVFLSKGGVGVNIFFTISGFILALPFLRHHLYGVGNLNIKKYFVRRLTRLEPPYIIIMSLFFLLQITFLGAEFWSLLTHYIASLFYVHYFVYDTWSVINPVAWSLETEVQFYLLAPVFALVFTLRKTYMRFVVYLVLIVAHTFFIVRFNAMINDYNLVKSIVYYFSNFFIGFILADLFLLFKFDKGTKNFLYDILGVLGLLGVFYFYYKAGYFNYIYFYICCMILFWSSFRGIIFNRILRNKVITTIGGMCYTIYLIHYVFIFSCMHVLKPWVVDMGLGFYEYYILFIIIILPLLLIVSGILFYLIEKPFMYPNWYKRKTNVA